eukprot:COSAG02_NODE_24359_length_690_cov_1.620981_2_plen_132_part_01
MDDEDDGEDDGPPLADEMMMELAPGCGLLGAAKELARARGDVEAASQRLLEEEGAAAGDAGDARRLLSPEELVWALRGSFASAGLRAQLEAICNVHAQQLQLYMRSSVSMALLTFVRERQPGMERDPAWRDT